VRIVLDTTILVRANESSHGLARQLLLDIVASRHTLLLSNEILYELASIPIRDVNDVVVVQTALIGEADVICTNDPGLARFLTRVGISVMDDITLMQRMRN
jgi:predicted nucleic acid-binding protein